MRPEDAADYLERVALVSTQPKRISLGPYRTLKKVLIPGGRESPELFLRAGLEFTFDGDEPCDVQQMIDDGEIELCEGD